MQDMLKPLKFPRDIQEIGTGWVVQNLIKYGNSALPTSLIEIMSDKTLGRLLSVIIEGEVTIKQSQYGYIAERAI